MRNLSGAAGPRQLVHIAFFIGTLGSAAILPADAASATGDSDRPDIGPLIAGQSSYLAGRYVATDYVYDDRGPNSNGVPGGDAGYPEGMANAADIVQVQLEPQNDAVSLRLILQTLKNAADSSIVVAFDTDNNAQTGASMLPGSSWTPSAPLGIEALLEVNGSDATLSRFDGERWVKQSAPTVAVDTVENTLDVDIDVAPSAADVWRVFVAAGLAQDPISQGGTIYDLAFLQGETVTDRELMIVDSINAALISGNTAMWQDNRQAAVLAGQLDPAAAAAAIDFSVLSQRLTQPATAETQGWHTFLYRSSIDLGEGIDSEAGVFGSNTFSTRIYRGRYQPYLVHRNAAAPDPTPLVVFLHGAGTIHTMNTYWFQNDDGGATLHYPAVTVFPLARGETLGYRDIAEFDVLEVLSDSKRRFNVDDDRVVLAGISMGGMGTYKLASLYPDLFSSAISHVGHGNAEVGIIENLLNVPFRASNGMLDYLVTPQSFMPDRERGMQLAYDFRFYDVYNGHHQIHPHLANCLYESALQTPRQAYPARVHYAIEPERFRDDAATGLKLSYDHAYWVTHIALRDKSARGAIDALSQARADRNTHKYFVDTVGAAEGRDFCGANPDLRLIDNPDGGSMWRERSVIHSPVVSPTQNALELSLDNIESITINTQLVDLHSDIPIELQISGDGISALELVGSWSGHYVLLKDGQPLSKIRAESGALSVTTDFSGTHTFTLIPKGRGHWKHAFKPE